MDKSIVNERISNLDDNGAAYEIPAMRGTDKVVPYQGWYWRTVEPDRIRLADNGAWVGFCESNKWGYPQTSLMGDEAKQVWDMLVGIAAKPSSEKLQALFDHLQTFKDRCK